MYNAFVLFGCPKCEALQYAKSSQKTRRCVGCGKSLQLSKVMVIAVADSADEARRKLVYFKTPPEVRVRISRMNQSRSQNNQYSEVADLMNVLLYKFRGAIPLDELLGLGDVLGYSALNIENGVAEMVRKKVITLDDSGAATLIRFPELPIEFGGVLIRK